MAGRQIESSVSCPSDSDRHETNFRFVPGVQRPLRTGSEPGPSPTRARCEADDTQRRARSEPDQSPIQARSEPDSPEINSQIATDLTPIRSRFAPDSLPICSRFATDLSPICAVLARFAPIRLPGACVLGRFVYPQFPSLKLKKREMGYFRRRH